MALARNKAGSPMPTDISEQTTMKSSLLLLAATGLGLVFTSCSSSSSQPVHLVSGVSTLRPPATTTPVTTVNGVAIHQYSPDVYTPFLYDHQGLAHNDYYQKRAIWNQRRQGTVQVGRLTVAESD